MPAKTTGGGPCWEFWWDQVVSFEMWDSREDDIQGYLNVDEINAHLKKFPVH